MMVSTGVRPIKDARNGALAALFVVMVMPAGVAAESSRSVAKWAPLLHQSGYDGLVDHRAPSFRRWLGQRHVDWRASSRKQRRRISAQYLDEMTTRFEDGRRIWREQRAALLRSLDYHFPAGTARGLAEQSAINRGRAIGSRAFVSSPAMTHAEELVRQLEPLFVHNSVIVRQKEEMPILSSRRLVSLGLRPGANSFRPFNRDFLGVADNVYFYLFWGMPHSPAGKLPERYGEHAHILDNRYARKHGWISAFVMYPTELFELGRLFAPTDYRAIKRWLKRESAVYTRDKRVEWQDVEKQPERWLRLRQGLHRFDFTLDDFVPLVQEQLLWRLDQLRRTKPGTFRRSMSQLKRGLVDAELHGSHLLKNLVFDPLGLPDVYELKVPVAVPSPAIREAGRADTLPLFGHRRSVVRR